MRTQQDLAMVTSSQTASTYSLHQPLWLRAVNAGGDVLHRLGLSFGHLDGPKFMEAACQQTGLHDFGTIPFQEPLQLLLHSCAHEAQLTLCGRLAVRYDVLRLLRNRLCLEADWQRHPGIAAQGIVRPLFIAGLPRTGTSLLHALLAQDPANRTPLSWEVMAPSPPPERAQSERDPRIAHVERRMRCLDWLAPDFKRIHEVGARLPQECVAIMSHIFRSPQFATTFHVPAYEAWINKADRRPAYHFHRRFLQQLQWRGAGPQWVLKSPAHLAGLDALLETYPDAGIIHTHRDPLVAIPSLASLRTVLHRAFSHAVDPHQIGLATTRYWAQVLCQAIQFRQAHPAAQRRFYDIYYPELMRDPLGTVERLYSHFGLPLTPEAVGRMRQYLAAHPHQQYGAHRYTMEQFGLRPTEEAERYRAYRDHFGIPPESLSS